MPAAGRLGDASQVPADAHGCPGCPHVAVGPAIAGSPDVNINSRPALRVGDKGVHAACCGSNSWTAVQGSPNVFINRRAAHRRGDADQHCGGVGKLIEGSGDVNINAGDAGGGAGAGGVAARGAPNAALATAGPEVVSRPTPGEVIGRRIRMALEDPLLAAALLAATFPGVGEIVAAGILLSTTESVVLGSMAELAALARGVTPASAAQFGDLMNVVATLREVPDLFRLATSGPFLRGIVDAAKGNPSSLVKALEGSIFSDPGYVNQSMDLLQSTREGRDLLTGVPPAPIANPGPQLWNANGPHFNPLPSLDDFHIQVNRPPEVILIEEKEPWEKWRF